MSDSNETASVERFARVGDLSPGAACRLLGSTRRRIVLCALATRSTPVAVEDLAEVVAGHEATATTDGRRVRVSLVHVALPALSDHGLIEYDPATSRVVDVAPAVDALDTGLDAPIPAGSVDGSG